MAGVAVLSSESANEQTRITKNELLETLDDIENEIRELSQATLAEKWKHLRGLVEHVMEDQENEMQILHEKIRALKEDVEEQKAKREKLESKLALTQATWEWEKHLARFVVHSSKRIYPSGWKDQMKDYLAHTNRANNRLKKIQAKLKITFTKQHWRVIENLRRERNCLAHPNLINLDFVESELMKMSPEYKTVLREMLHELKMTASLMKFGRLVNHMFGNKKMVGKNVNRKAMTHMISWDCNFEDIGGLQNIEHEEAKQYLEKFVDNPKQINHYFSIVDFIKDANSERLGKLAWEMEGKLTETYSSALSDLKKLLPNPDAKSKSPQELDVTIAKLHVPDVLPKPLWKHGIEIVEKYFRKIAKQTA